MNLTGKIFTTFIFGMSVIFMGLVLAVYAKHQHWRNMVMDPDPNVGLAAKLDVQDEKIQKLKDQLDKLKNDNATEQIERGRELKNLRSERDALNNERDEQDQNIIRLNQDRSEATAAMDIAHETLKGMRAQVDTLEKDRDAARADFKMQFNMYTKTKDALHHANREIKTLKEANTTLADNHSKALAVLRHFGHKPHPELYAGIPPAVDGIVSAVRSGGLLEVNIGSDEGLQPGHQLEVVRRGPTSMYLGRVEITNVEPDKAVAKVIPEFLKGAIQGGDHVAARL